MRLAVLNVAYPLAPVGPDAVGGAEQVLTAIDARLVSEGHRSLVLACEGSRVEGELIAFPLPADAFVPERRAALQAAYAARLARLLATVPIDVVHFHGVDFDAYRPPVGPPALCTLHLPPDWYPADVFRTPDLHLHCVSSSQRRACPPGAPLLEDVPNGVDLARFRPGASPGTPPYVLMLGRICPEKGIHLGLEAARRAGIRLWLGGRLFPYPDHRRYFEREVAPRLDDERQFLGPIEMPRKAALLAGARCLLIPSLAAETSSLVSMEALACGTPVVAFRRGALAELIDDGETGVLADSVEELATGIARAATLSRRRCRRVAEARFSAAAMCGRYLDLYARLAGARASRPLCPPNIEVAEHDTLAAVEALETEWRALWERCPRATIFQSPDWLFAWCRHLLAGTPRLLTFRRAGVLVGVAPLFAWTTAAGTRVLSLMGAGVSDYQDVLFAPEHAAGCGEALARWLGQAAWDRTEWSELVENSPLLALPGAPADAQDVCPGLPLDEERSPIPPGVLRQLEYVRRRAAREGGLAIEPAHEGNLEPLLDALETLHAARWRERGHDGALAQAAVRAFHRAVARRLMKTGRLMLHGVRLGDARAAVLYGFHDREVTRYYLGGFDPARARLSPGLLAVAHGIECARARGSRVFDFLRGGEPYKYRWGARDLARVYRRITPRAPS